MGANAKRRYEWFTMPAPKLVGIADPDDDPRTGEPFKVKLLANPRGVDIQAESESHAAMLDKRITERDYLVEIADRIVDWNFEGPDGERIAAPGAFPDNPDSVNAFYELDQDQLTWLLGLIRFSHIPKAIRRLLGIAGSTDSNTPTANPEAAPSEHLAS